MVIKALYFKELNKSAGSDSFIKKWQIFHATLFLDTPGVQTYLSKYKYNLSNNSGTLSIHFNRKKIQKANLFLLLTIIFVQFAT